MNRDDFLDQAQRNILRQFESRRCMDCERKIKSGIRCDGCMDIEAKI